MSKSLKTTAKNTVIALALLPLLTAPTTAADFKWWHTTAPDAPNTNGSITLPTGTGSRTLTKNPTSAVLQATRSTNSQPPTILVQATASLPVKVEGSACTAATSGTAPNQTADEGTAITADRSVLLSCQSGVWAKQSSGGSGIGAWTFQVAGNSMLGTGSYNSSTGTFSGSFICDPATYGTGCGTGSNWWCNGTDTACAWHYSSISYGPYKGVVRTADLPVTSATQKW